MHKIESFINRLLKPYRNYIDVQQKKEEILLQLEKDATKYYNQGYDDDEINDLLKQSVAKIWRRLDKVIMVDRARFFKLAANHYLLFSLLAIALLLPAVLLGATPFYFVPYLIFLIPLLIFRLCLKSNPGKMKINVFKMHRHHIYMFFVWFVVVFLALTAIVTEYISEQFGIKDCLFHIYFILVSFIVPISYYTVDHVVKECRY